MLRLGRSTVSALTSCFLIHQEKFSQNIWHTDTIVKVLLISTSLVEAPAGCLHLQTKVGPAVHFCFVQCSSKSFLQEHAMQMNLCQSTAELSQLTWKHLNAATIMFLCEGGVSAFIYVTHIFFCRTRTSVLVSLKGNSLFHMFSVFHESSEKQDFSRLSSSH